MALVVFLRGVNVGGHRTVRPTELAKQLAHLDVVNIGAAGTFVVRKPITHARLRAELASRLPFAAVVPFVSVLAKSPKSTPPTPANLPAGRQWLVRILAREGRFVLGLYRRQMKAIGHLGEIDRLFGTPATTRNWNTLRAIGRVLGNG